jgi:16S rRNA (guanine527-N7)-methyltransferase
MQQKFRSAIKALGLSLSEDQLATLRLFVTLLLDWNKKVNLVSRSDIGNIWFAHVLHSLAVLSVFRIRQKARILDIGAGGGLPSVPIAIARPDTSVTAVDSIRKKTKALSSIVISLGLPNIEVVNSRVEALGDHRDNARRYDIVIARAVAPLTDLINWSKPLLQPGEDAALLAMKGGDLGAEIEEARIKTRPRRIQERPFVFERGGEFGLVDKKLIVVTP